jgi:hypothetical protein
MALDRPQVAAPTPVNHQPNQNTMIMVTNGYLSASFKDNVARVQKEIFKGIDDLKYGPGSSSRH